VLAIGRRADYDFKHEPTPGAVIELAHEFIGQHPDL
jgi:hypothetical protein